MVRHVISFVCGVNMGKQTFFVGDQGVAINCINLPDGRVRVALCAS